MTEISKTNVWKPEDDKILKEWVDKSACYKWLHDKSYKIYRRQYLVFMIPVIVISTLTGAGNFALERIPEPYRGYSNLIIGSFNIIAAIISTVAQFIKIAELKEGHNISTKNWDKFNRSLKMELYRNPSERSDKKELFELSRKEYDRLIENSPDIPNSVINEFKKKFKDKNDLKKPEICDTIESSTIYANTSPADTVKSIQTAEFINAFKSKHNREPTEEEIDEHFDLLHV